MAAVTRAHVKISTEELLDAYDPLEIVREFDSVVAIGPMQIQVLPGVTGQELRIVGAQGIGNIYTTFIKTDTDITILYSNTAPVALLSGGFHLLSGTNTPTISITNTTGDIATLTVWLAGAAPIQALATGNFVVTGNDVIFTVDIAVTCTALSSGLIACWDMDELTGTRVDHIGAFNVAMTNSVPGVTGKVRKAAQFVLATPVNYLSRAADFYRLGASAFTLAFWVQLSSLPGTNQAIISMGNSPNAGQYTWLVLALSTGQIEGAFDGGGAGVILSSSNLSVGAWTFVVIWHDGTNLRLQMNNGTIASSAAVFRDIIGATGTFSFGAMGIGNTKLDGLVDSTQVWNRVLSAGERSTVWNSGAGI